MGRNNCCDIIVVDQMDGSLKSTPFYVQFKPPNTKNDIHSTPRRFVRIQVNGVPLDDHIYMELEPGHTRAHFPPSLSAVSVKPVHTMKKIEKAEHMVTQWPQIEKPPFHVQLLNKWMNTEDVLKRLDSEREYDLDQLIPSGQLLQGMKLNYGENIIRFKLDWNDNDKDEDEGNEIEGRIYYWKSDTKIVVSDVDGTVTISDKRGLLTSGMGNYTWIHSGIAQLLSSMTTDYGYQILYLTARPIEYTMFTRQFLERVEEEEGHKLPKGPILTSFNSFAYTIMREYVLQRADSNKIEALKNVKHMFPQNPFVCGFGNRRTDYLAYLAVGIPVDKVFIVDERSQVRGVLEEREHSFNTYVEVREKLGILLPSINRLTESLSHVPVKHAASLNRVRNPKSKFPTRAVTRLVLRGNTWATLSATAAGVYILNRSNHKRKQSKGL